MPVSVVCEQCQKEFSRSPKDVKKVRHHFCSVSCSRAWRRKLKIKLVCEQCGKKIFRSPSRVYRHQFCSHECSLSWRRKVAAAKLRGTSIKTHCDYCERPFRIVASRIAPSGKTYCSPDCYHKSRQDWFSTYNYRGLESTPKQLLVRFLIMHGIGQAGAPGEQVIIYVKNGFYVPGISPHDSPLVLLAHDLRKLGHYKLAQQVLDGTWEREEDWLCYAEGWVRRRPKQLPWEE